MDVMAGRLRQLREKCNLSQQRMGEMIGSTQSAIAHYEAGRKIPSRDLIVQLCKVFDVSADYLLGLSDDPKRK